MQVAMECHEDGVEFEYKLIITGIYIGDKNEIINKDSVIRMHELYEADFEIEEVKVESVGK